MNTKKNHLTELLLILMLLLAGCGGSDGNGESQTRDNDDGALTEFEQTHGVGPVNEVVTIDEIDPEQVALGKEIFRTKCSACHKMDQDYVGPPLGEVLENRTPAYVMNMILNPVEMTQKHPEARKMLAQYMNQMTFQNVSQEEARAIVEYLATVETEDENDEDEEEESEDSKN